MKIDNKKAFFDYTLLDKIEAGINLTGQEVKAIRLGHVDLSGSFIKLIGSEAYLVNAKIYPYEFARTENYDSKRTRKLLLHKKEIISLKSKIEGSNLTIVPVSMYNTLTRIKLEIAIGKPKKEYDKKEIKKKKDIDRQIESELKEFIKS